MTVQLYKLCRGQEEWFRTTVPEFKLPWKQGDQDHRYQGDQKPGFRILRVQSSISASRGSGNRVAGSRVFGNGVNDSRVNSEIVWVLLVWVRLG